MNTTVLPSVLRTIVPLLVGYFAAWPVAKGLGVSDDQITSLVTVLVTAAYYLVVRALEKVAPQFGWLLGYASAPEYSPAAVPAGKGDTGQVTYDLVFVLLVIALLVAIFLKVYGVV